MVETIETAVPKRTLSLFDAVCIILGIIIGAGIFQMPPQIAQGVNGPMGVYLIWLVGGLLALAGALCYAELATTYPQEGGDYVYLSRAYGPWAGFLFGWSQLTIIRPGDIAVVAFAFAAYARTLYDPFGPDAPFDVERLYAAGVVLVMTALNVVGVRAEVRTQNLLTILKALGLLAVVLAAFLGTSSSPASVAEASPQTLPLSLALIFVLFTFGGWNEMAYVAAEVRDPHRQIPRALLLGTGAVTALYLLVNAAYMHVLGHAGLAASSAPATDTVAAAWPDAAGRAVAVLVCVSTLGAVNGLIFTGARITYALGRDHKVFRYLGEWEQNAGVPRHAIILQGGLAIALILLLGSFLHTLVYTAAAVYTFYFGTAISCLILRRTEPSTARPFRMPLFPLPPLILASMCVLLIHSSLTYAWATRRISLVVLGSLLAIGLFLAIASQRSSRNSESTEPQQD